MNETPPKKHIHVACALIERNGLVLSAQRSAIMSLPLKWEFPGGKVEEGESPEECLHREMMEELGAEVTVRHPLSQLTHSYDNFTVTLYPFLCALKSERITLHEHSAVVWLPPGELHTLDWLEADRPVLEAYIRTCPKP